MTPRASLCPAISRSTTRRNRSSSPSLMLPSTAASRSAPPRRPWPYVACLHLVRLWSKECPSRLQHLRHLQRFYMLQFHYAAGRRTAIRLDNPFVTIIKGKACLSFYRRPHHLAELVYAVWLVAALQLQVQF